MVAGSRGSASRASILRILLAKPQNANQLASALDLDYSTVKHHLHVLQRHGLVFAEASEGYARTFHPTPRVRDDLASYLFP